MVYFIVNITGKLWIYTRLCQYHDVKTAYTRGDECFMRTRTLPAINVLCGCPYWKERPVRSVVLHRSLIYLQCGSSNADKGLERDLLDSTNDLLLT